ncbi:nitrilase-related carbon-nitrogen hydrolase [Desulfosporosinus sp. PR]|uniref:nitrilase-related carbon-nitrogen hydrolase n=1 Tax=Candidatus Desulfosporosinus nitrosoreducens TaxID=3401928 RepID=UPI0027E6E871|nr:nitrilase-related carbon-nitrogen hydrolase [Desulfosporosinus sp. PR]MDQ7094960.1 nitrilase-related carbon-nitrogen hydrolase [Desulfosporosinus sp. PR]
MKQDCRIGLVQMESYVGESDLNCKRITHLAQVASQQEISFLCFPECALDGYSPQDASEIGDSLQSPRISRLRECAEDLKITLLVGLVEQTSDKKKPYISQVILSPGKEDMVYRKVHLGRSEQDFFSPGDKFPVFKAHGMNFAVGICWDWHFPEMAAIYSLKGAELIFAPHASPVIAGDRKEIWLRYLGTRAYDNSVYLGACNLIGSNGKAKEFSGGTLVIGPKGEVIEQTEFLEESITTALLSAERINRIRRFDRASMRDSFFLADRKKELYHELIQLEVTQQDKEG